MKRDAHTAIEGQISEGAGRVVEADVISVKRETRHAIVRPVTGSHNTVVQLGSIEPEALLDGKGKVLLYADRDGFHPVGTIQVRPADPGVTLRDMLGGSKWHIYDSSGTEVAYIDSDGLISLEGGIELGGSARVQSHVLPDATGTRNLGSSSLHWGTIYADSLVGSAAHDPISLDVNAETLLSLSTQELGLDTQTANYIFAGPTSGGAAVPTFRALVVADIPSGYDHADLSNVLTDQHHAQSHIITGGDHTVTGSQYQLVGLTGTDTIGLLTPSYNPSGASILRTDASGYLTVVKLSTDTLADKSGGNLTIQPAGDLILSPTGDDVLPGDVLSINLGSSTYKFLQIWGGELRITNLVADNVVATINGRIVVRDSTFLREALGTDDPSDYICVEHNNLARQDFLYMESGGNVEFMQVDSLAIAITDFINDEFEVAGDWTTYFRNGVKFTVAESDNNNQEWTCDGDSTYSGGNTIIAVTGDVLSNSGSEGYIYYSGDQLTGPFYYFNIDRGLDGTPHSWAVGDSVVNTGYQYDGFIDLYSQDGIAGGSSGPTIVGVVRTGTTYDSLVEHWAIGNLDGLYGYSGDTYGVALGQFAASRVWHSIDATNGYRVNLGTAPTVLGQWDNSGNVTFGQVATDYGNAYWNAGNQRLEFRGGTNGTDVEAYIDTDGSITWGGGVGKAGSDGIKITPSTSWDDVRAFTFHNGSNYLGGLYSYASGGVNLVYLRSLPVSTDLSYAAITAEAASTYLAVAQIRAKSGSTEGYFQINADSDGVSEAILSNVGLRLGIGETPSSGQLFTYDDVRIGSNGALSVGSQTYAPPAETIYVSDYIVALGGIHVGGTSDPGTDNLVVDAQATIGTIIFINETANANMTYGLTINHGTTGEAIALKGSNVLWTGGAETGYEGAEKDTYASLALASSTDGGLKLTGYRDAGTGRAVLVRGFLNANADTAKTTAAQGIIDLYAAQLSSGSLANVVADGNILTVRCYKGGATSTVFLIDEDGDVYAGGKLWGGESVSTNGGTNYWTLAGYTASAPSATGYVTVTINGTAYKLLAAPA